MKRSNFILSTIGLVSILGGALAFKAQQRFVGRLLCYTTIGMFVGGRRVYAAVLNTRYTTTSGVKTLSCTIPAANNVYVEVKVVASE